MTLESGLFWSSTLVLFVPLRRCPTDLPCVAAKEMERGSPADALFEQQLLANGIPFFRPFEGRHS